MTLVPTQTHPLIDVTCLATGGTCLLSLMKAASPEMEIVAQRSQVLTLRQPALPVWNKSYGCESGQLGRVEESTDMQNHRARSGQIHFIQSWHQTGGSPAVGASAPDEGPLPQLRD